MAESESGIGSVLGAGNQLSLPVVVIGEFRYGIRQLRSHTRYESWLSAIIARCRILDLDQETAAEYAEIRLELKRKGRPIPTNDLWIAALARQHSLPVISRDQHFDFVSRLKRISW